jgi:Amt family ammonium transporter
MRFVFLTLASLFLLLSLAMAPVFAQDAALSASSLATETAETAAPVAEVVPESVPAVAAPEPSVPVVAAPLTKPTLVSASTISAGDTAWMMMSTALVLLMTIPGVALFYTGMVRKKNVLSTMAHSFVAVCIVSVLWVIAWRLPLELPLGSAALTALC